MAKTEKTLERTYNVPLRREFLKVPRYKRTKKAVSAMKDYLSKHMKSEDVRLGKHLNEELWKHGIRNPPHHVKVTVQKDEKGVVRAELFGHKIELKKEPEKKTKLQEIAEKAGVKTPKKEENKDEKPAKAPKAEPVEEVPKIEEKPAAPKEETKAEEQKPKVEE
jgi:large subunit ribosomal protein L31e